MIKLIVAFAGEMGGGKGVAVQYLVEKYSASSHKYSNILRDILDRLYLPQTRENIANTSRIIREAFGEDIMESSMLQDVLNDKSEIVVLDGARRKEDIQKFISMPGFKLVFIEASPEVRYKRLVSRGENAGDNTKTFEQFLLDHKANADVRISSLKDFADYIIQNNGTYEQLYAQIDKVIEENI